MGLTKEPIKYRMPRFMTMSHVAQGLYNDLERVSLQSYPILSDIKKALDGKRGSGFSNVGKWPHDLWYFQERGGREESRI